MSDSLYEHSWEPRATVGYRCVKCRKTGCDPLPTVGCISDEDWKKSIERLPPEALTESEKDVLSERSDGVFDQDYWNW